MAGSSAGLHESESKLSSETVDRHRANVLQKLGMRDRLDLTKFAIRTGLIEP